jgi:hypothetical protein
MQSESAAHLMDYLKENGHTPLKIKYGSAWFVSPFRNERTASFKVNLSRNLWFDFGTGEGGNLVTLIMKLRTMNFSDAQELIMTNNYPVGKFITGPGDDSGHIKVESICPVSHPALLQYLCSRKVSRRFSRLYLEEARYSVNGGKYFALAFKNDHGGYELRNAKFKTGSSPKYITTIQGADISGINVFEGFMDFLSCCSHYNSIPVFKTVILNSLSFLPRIESLLHDSTKINLFLDNDQAGRTATQRIMDTCGNVKDWAPIIYPDHKDFNEFFMKAGNNSIRLMTTNSILGR